MLFLLAIMLCPPLAFISVVRYLTREGRALYRDSAMRELAARVTAEQAELKAAETPVVDDRPVYRPVELAPSLVAMMKRDGFA